MHRNFAVPSITESRGFSQIRKINYNTENDRIWIPQLNIMCLASAKWTTQKTSPKTVQELIIFQ